MINKNIKTKSLSKCNKVRKIVTEKKTALRGIGKSEKSGKENIGESWRHMEYKRIKKVKRKT